MHTLKGREDRRWEAERRRRMRSMRSALSGTKRKDGRWSVVVTQTRPDGTKARKTLYASTQREVQQKARDLLATEGRTAHLPHSVEDLIRIYKAERWENLAPGTKRQHGPAYKRIQAHFVADVRDIDATTVARWLKSMATDASVGGRAIQAYRNVLSVLLGYAEDLGWREGNPAKGRALPLSAEPKIRPRLTEQDFAAILEGETDEVLRDLWQFLGQTGMRPNEALILKRSDVFRSMDLWWIRGGMKTAAGINREIPLADDLAYRLLEREEWLFPFGTCHLLYNYVRDKWEERVRATDIPYTNLYQLRKLTLSRWRHAGLPEDAIKAMAGHTSIEMTDRVYVRLGRDRLMNAMFGVQYVNGMSGVSQESGRSPID